MNNYTWVFLETGSVRKKLTFILCSPAKIGYIVKDKITDLNVAYQYEKGAEDAGHTFTNHIGDFLDGKLRRMDQKTFNAFIKGIL